MNKDCVLLSLGREISTKHMKFPLCWEGLCSSMLSGRGSFQRGGVQTALSQFPAPRVTTWSFLDNKSGSHMHDFWAAVLRKRCTFSNILVFMIPPDTEYTEALKGCRSQGSLDPWITMRQEAPGQPEIPTFGLLLSKDKKKKKKNLYCASPWNLEFIYPPSLRIRILFL